MAVKAPVMAHADELMIGVDTLVMEVATEEIVGEGGSFGEVCMIEVEVNTGENGDIFDDEDGSGVEGTNDEVVGGGGSFGDVCMVKVELNTDENGNDAIEDEDGSGGHP